MSSAFTDSYGVTWTYIGGLRWTPKRSLGEYQEAVVQGDANSTIWKAVHRTMTHHTPSRLAAADWVSERVLARQVESALLRGDP